MSDDPRMAMTLRDVERYLIIPRHHALVLWNFPILCGAWKIVEVFDPFLYPGAQQKCSPSE